MREIELRRKMKATVVPTNDADVRKMLRQLGEPITLFGEREVRWQAGLPPCRQGGTSCLISGRLSMAACLRGTAAGSGCGSV